MPTTPNSPESLVADESRILEATRLAWRWHGLQRRKGKPISYMSHLLQVQGLVISAGGSAEQSIAALLHDSLEDAPTPHERALLRGLPGHLGRPAGGAQGSLQGRHGLARGPFHVGHTRSTNSERDVTVNVGRRT